MVARIPGSGRITNGIRPNTLVNQTIGFIENQLDQWRDDKKRPIVEAEEDLNGQLCKFLNDRAREEFPMACFHHEEKQGSRRRVDVSAIPSSAAIRAGLHESIYEPFLVIEGKRLPAPSTARKREYLTGLTAKSGGIQRFRLCLHGKMLKSAVMIGYVQAGSVADWLNTINGWISDLEESGEDDSCCWSRADHLDGLIDGGQKASRCESNHTRIEGVQSVRLIHLWICMKRRES